MATGLENRARNSLRTLMAESENINAFCAKERDTSREIGRNSAMSKEGEREK
jgi:hypothetical protein